MKSRTWIAGASVVLMSMLLPGMVMAQSPPQTRNGWLVGFGLGAGSAGVSGGGSRETGGAVSLRLGYAFQPQFSLELDSNGWSKSQDGATLTFTVTGAALNYYPGAQGFVLRAGIGSGSGKLSASSGNTNVSATESGLGILVGAGYEFRVRRTFAIGPQLDYGWISLDGGKLNYVNGCLGFNWYFIPKS